jgi:hypothetical protein
MSSALITLIIVVLILFCVLYIVRLLPVSWRIKQIISIIIILLALIYLFQHPGLLHVW